MRTLFFWLTLLALPWQTRWFQEGPSLGEFPWEQGRISIYASWIFMLSSFALRAISFRRPCEGEDLLTPSRHPGNNTNTIIKKTLLFGIYLLFVLVLFHTSSPRATFQFSLEWLMLSFFLWSVLDLRIPFKKFSLGYAASLIPAALFGLWQYAVQSVPAMKYAGIAAQNPLIRGVSVLEVMGERVLRVYGTFPHPNIFAGWLAIAILLLVLTIPLWEKRWQRISLLAGLNLFLVTLLLTYSRAAIIALMVGGVVMSLLPRFRKQIFLLGKPFLILSFIITLTTASVTFWQTRELWFIRAQSTARLEQRSVHERTQSLRDGIRVFKQASWLGVGPGAELLAIQSLHPETKSPPVPPHLFWLVMLNEIGLVGVIGLVILFLSLVLAKARTFSVILGLDPRTHQNLLFSYPLIATLFTLSLFDHYLWTSWSGKAFLAVCILSIHSLTLDKKVFENT